MPIFSFRVLILIFFVYASSSSTFAQTNHIANLQTWILQAFPEAGLDEETLYIIDGVPIDQENLENELSKYKPNELSSITYLGEKAKKSLFCRPWENMVLIVTPQKGSQKWLKENYKQAKELFNETSEPALIMNGERINPDESRTLIRELELSQIKNICIVTQPVSINYYGENGANGLVMIVKR